jgi:hypothetical protein
MRNPFFFVAAALLASTGASAALKDDLPYEVQEQASCAAFAALVHQERLQNPAAWPGFPKLKGGGDALGAKVAAIIKTETDASDETIRSYFAGLVESVQMLGASGESDAAERTAALASDCTPIVADLLK